MLDQTKCVDLYRCSDFIFKKKYTIKIINIEANYKIEWKSYQKLNKKFLSFSKYQNKMRSAISTTFYDPQPSHGGINELGERRIQKKGTKMTPRKLTAPLPSLKRWTQQNLLAFLKFTTQNQWHNVAKTSKTSGFGEPSKEIDKRNAIDRKPIKTSGKSEAKSDRWT